MKRPLAVLLIGSLLLNLLSLVAGAYYVHERGPKAVLADVGLYTYPRPDYVAYASEYAAGLPGEDIMAIGDSQIANGQWTELLGVPVGSRGQSGAQIREVTAALPYTLQNTPTTILVWVGTNDVLDGRTPAQEKADYNALLDALEQAAPAARIIMLTIPPLDVAGVDQANTAMRDAAEGRATILDVAAAYAHGGHADDGIHTTVAAYERIAADLTPLLSTSTEG